LVPGQHNLKDDPEAMRAFIASVDCLILNKDEAGFLLAPDDTEQAKRLLSDERALIRALHGVGARTVALTDGEAGAWASDGKTLFRTPIPKRLRPILDTTGAGDAFASGFYGALTCGLSLEKALTAGIWNSQSVLSFYGTTRGLLRPDGAFHADRPLAVERLT
jgi:sugar/nucleoside kinase (ribokinase family)